MDEGFERRWNSEGDGWARGLVRPGRREFMAAAAALTAHALLPGRGLAERPQQRDTRKEKTTPGPWIDVHHHFAPPAYTEVLQAKKIMPPPLIGWSPEKTIEDMDRGGVASAMNSIVGPGVWFDDAEQARRLAREANEYAAKLVANYPGRFGSFATLTLPDIDGSLREMEYALDTLKADGIMLFTSYGDKWMGDPVFWPVLEELNRRQAVLFIHPTTNACCANLLPGISSAMIEYGTDTTRAIVRMISSGAAMRYPNIRVIFSHGGGTMPYLFTRFVNLHEGGGGGQQKKDVRKQHDFAAEFAKFYYDTAQAFNPIPMNALKSAVPISQILFGTDFPYRTSRESTSGLLSAKVFKPEELKAIQYENARRLLPRLRTPPA